MTITVLTGAGNVTENGSGTASNTMTGNKPSNTANGDTLIAAVYNRNPDTQTGPGGWTGFTPIFDSTEGASGLRLWHHTVTDAGSEPASWDWTKTGTAAKWIVIVFRTTGVDSADEEDAFGADSATTGTTSLVIPEVITAVNGAMVIGVGGAPRGNATAPVFSTPTDMTEIGQVDFNDGSSSATLALWYEARPTAGATGSRTSTITNAASHSVGFLISLTPAAETGLTFLYPITNPVPLLR